MERNRKMVYQRIWTCMLIVLIAVGSVGCGDLEPENRGSFAKPQRVGTATEYYPESNPEEILIESLLEITVSEPTARTIEMASESSTEQEEQESVQKIVERETEEQFTVYVTPTGECYHYDIDCAGKNAIPTTRSQAQIGFRPCKKCAE